MDLGHISDRNHLAFDELSELWGESNSTGEFVDKVTNLPFYKALIFTLTYCIIVTPCVLLLGFIIALSLKCGIQKNKGAINLWNNFTYDRNTLSWFISFILDGRCRRNYWCKFANINE